DLLAVRDARLDAARVVRVTATVAPDLVVRLRAAQPGEGEAVADLDTFHRLDPHHGRRQPRVEAVLFRRVAAQARRPPRPPDLGRPPPPCRGRPSPRRPPCAVPLRPRPPR